MFTSIVREDLINIHSRLTDKEKMIFNGKTILVTGFAGSIGYMLLSYFKQFYVELGIKKVIGIDNYMFGKPEWIADFDDEEFELVCEDVTTCDLTFASDAKIIFHMASLASPIYYRLHPIETIDADVLGLRRLLDFYKDKNIYDLLFFSTSEIYGNPAEGQVPTGEDYWGNVNTSGPRSCYDESKRFGETLCYNYHNVYNMPLTVIRPFNAFGPGLRTNDKRVVADFADNILNNEDIVIFSDGKATRTFCYNADTIQGILKCALYGQYDIFNIGYDKEEITVTTLAQKYKKVGEELFEHSSDIVYRVHEDKHYLTDNPQRRCPDISKAQRLLGYKPMYGTDEAIKRYILHLQEDRR